MKKELLYLLPLFFVCLLPLLFLSGCKGDNGGGGTPNDPNDKTPPIVSVKFERVDKETSRSDGKVELTENRYLRLQDGSVLRIDVSVIDQESGVSSVVLVKQSNGNDLLWSCQHGPGTLVGASQAADILYTPALPAATGGKGYGTLLTADPYSQAHGTCGNLPIATFDGWIQIEATNGAGLTARSGELHFGI